MSKKETFGVAILGAGHIAQSHLKSYPDNAPNAHVVAICDIDAEAARVTADTFAIPRVYSKVEELVSDSEVDIVVVCTPPSVREKVVAPLALGGKHLLVEKPFALTLAEAENMVRIAREANVRLAVDQNYRWRGDTEIVAGLLQQGAVGRVVSYFQQMFMWRSPGDGQPGWRETTPQLELSVMSVHWVDRMCWLLQRRPESVTCLMKRNSAVRAEGETLSAVLFEFDQDVVGNMYSCWHSRAGRREGIIIDGTEGSIETVGFKKVIHTPHIGEPQEFAVDKPFIATFGESLQRFADAIAADVEPPHSGENNLVTMEVVDACYRSARTGSRITFELGSTGGISARVG